MTEDLQIEITQKEVEKAVAISIEYCKKFGSAKYQEEKHARCMSDFVTNPPEALVHDVFEGLPITPTEFALERRTSN